MNVPANPLVTLLALAAICCRYRAGTLRIMIDKGFFGDLAEKPGQPM